MMSLPESMILDRNCESLGIPVSTLMDNAGAALFDVVSKEFAGKKILIVCGTGNNGGDGFACAKRFGRRADVALLFPSDKIKTDAAKRQFDLLRKRPMLFADVSVNEYDVIVDCALGTGVRAPLDEVYIKYSKVLKEFKGTIVSADVPTGFGTDDHLIPDITITFHDVKENMNEMNCGRIIVADIGIPDDASRVVGPGDMLRYPVPKKDSHKGDNGRLLVIGGGPYIGAPAMAAMAALRVGSDIVRIAAPRSSFDHIASMTPTFIMHRTSDDILTENDVPYLLELSDKVDAVLIGPGLGTDERTMTAVRKFMNACERPMTADADGITAISSLSRIPDNVIITPHRKEFETFSGECNGDRIAEISEERNVTILLKGSVDKIAQNKNIRLNRTGTPAMTVGGTGDVLSGIVAGLLSKGMNTFNAACLGAFICGSAGEKAFSEKSYGMIATDVIDMIPEVLKDHLKG